MGHTHVLHLLPELYLLDTDHTIRQVISNTSQKLALPSVKSMSVTSSTSPTQCSDDNVSYQFFHPTRFTGGEGKGSMVQDEGGDSLRVEQKIYYFTEMDTHKKEGSLKKNSLRRSKQAGESYLGRVGSYPHTGKVENSYTHNWKDLDMGKDKSQKSKMCVVS